MTLALPARRDTITDPNPGPHLKIRPMEEVLALHSGDSWDWMEDRTVRGMLDHKRDAQYRQLMKLIPEIGFQAGYGVSIQRHWSGEGEYLSNGHHRVTALHDLGARWVPISDEQDKRWDEQVEGYDPYQFDDSDD